MVFIGAALAVIVASAIGVVAGGLIAQNASPNLLSYVAAIGFVVIGAWTIWQRAIST